MPEIKVTNEITLTGTAIVVIVIISSFLGGLVVFILYDFSHIFTGLACWSLAAFLSFSSYLYYQAVSDTQSRHKPDDTDDTIWKVFALFSFFALVAFGLLAKAIDLAPKS
jgi:hypothetical protein